MSYVTLAFFAVLLTSIPMYSTAARIAREGLERQLEAGVRTLVVVMSRAALPIDAAALDEHVDAQAQAADVRLTIIASDGTVLADSEFDDLALAALDNHNSRAEVGAARREGTGRSVRYSRSTGVNRVYYAMRIDVGPWAGAVARATVTEERVAAATRSAYLTWLGAMMLALGFTGLVGYLWARRFSRPVEVLKRAAEDVRDGRDVERLRIQTGDELQELAEALEGARRQLAARIEQLVGERDQLEAVLEEMVEGVVVTDAEGRVVLANPALAGLFGVELPTLGQTVTEALRNPDVSATMEEAMGREGRLVRQFSVSYPEERTLNLHVIGLRHGGAVGVFHDVTALQRVNTMRQDFVANVSHELRTPLAAIAAHSESLTVPGLDDEDQHASIEAIRRQVERLTALVRDLLALSRLESERLELSLELIDATSFVADLAEEFAGRADERGQRIEIDVEPGLEIHADPRLLSQAVGNLLENAVKYAGDGARIAVSAQRVGAAAEIAVADNGPGVRGEDQSRIFERFYRVDKGRARSNGGTGLGLAIVKHVAEVHGGGVGLESRPGEGATFRIVIPCGADPTREEGDSDDTER